MAMGHVILKRFHLDNPERLLPLTTAATTPTCRMLVLLDDRDDGTSVPGRMVRASDLLDGLGESNNPEWKTVAFSSAGELVAPNGFYRFSLGRKGKWNLEPRAAGKETELALSPLNIKDTVAAVGFPYFGGNENPHFRSVEQQPVLIHRLPAKRLTLASGESKTGGERPRPRSRLTTASTGARR